MTSLTGMRAGACPLCRDAGVPKLAGLAEMVSGRQIGTRLSRPSIYYGWLAWSLCSSACSLLVDADQYSVAQGSLGSGGTTSRPGDVLVVGPAMTISPAPGAAGSSALSPPVSPAVPPATPTMGARAEVESILAANCGSCHGRALTAGQAEGSFNYVDDVERLLENGKLVPLNSAGSRVVQRIVRGEMPPVSSSQPRMSAADLATLRGYIDDPRNWPELMPAVDCRDDGQLVDFDELYQRVNSDLGAAASDDQPFFRYFSLTNRFTAGECPVALDTDRQALTALLSALSDGDPRLVTVDSDRTLYRVDLRLLGWNRAITVDGQSFDDVWEAIAASNPYAVELQGDDADDAVADTQTSFPIMFADHVLDVTLMGNLSSAILGASSQGLVLRSSALLQAVSRRFNAAVGLADAAGDLGLTPDDLANNLNLLDAALQPLGSGTLTRAVFTALYVDSLCRISTVLENQPAVAACNAAAAALR